MITQWKKPLKEQLTDFFSTSKPSAVIDEKLVEKPYQKIGQVEMD
jgi:hypothetical protein